MIDKTIKALYEIKGKLWALYPFIESDSALECSYKSTIEQIEILINELEEFGHE